MAVATDKEIFSTHDAAKICRVTPMTVIRWIEEGKIPAFKTVGGHRRILRDDLDSFCRSRGIPFAPGDAGTGRILVVDGDPDMRELVATAARAVDPGLSIELAGDGFAAGLLVARFRPNVVFLDVRVHGLDAHETCVRLCRDPETAGIAVIITAPSFAADAERSYRARGANACLAKPPEQMIIDRLLRTALRLDEASPEPRPATSVLLVDVDGGARRALGTGLEERLPGCRVLQCDTAMDAMLAIGAERPDLVVVDAALGGLDIARRVRARTTAAPTVVVIVGASDERHRREALDAGAIWVTRPVSVDALLPHVNAGLATGSSPATGPKKRR